MSCKYLTRKCNHCNHSQENLVYFDDQTNSDLQKYKNYLNFKLQICKNCGYISTNIENECFSGFNNLQKSDEYADALNYEYIDDFKDVLNTEMFENYPANIYECYAIYKEKCFDYDEALRGYFRAVILKEAIVRRYNQAKYEEMDLEEDINNLIKSVNFSIEQNISKIFNLFALSSKTTYNKIILIECYLRYNKIEEAEDLYDQVKSKTDNSISDYIDNLFTQRR